MYHVYSQLTIPVLEKQSRTPTLSESKPESKPCQRPGRRMWHSAGLLDGHSPVHFSGWQIQQVWPPHRDIHSDYIISGSNTTFSLSCSEHRVSHFQETLSGNWWRHLPWRHFLRLTNDYIFTCALHERPLHQVSLRFKCWQKDLFLLRNHLVFFLFHLCPPANFTTTFWLWRLTASIRARYFFVTARRWHSFPVNVSNQYFCSAWFLLYLFSVRWGKSFM